VGERYSYEVQDKNNVKTEEQPDQGEESTTGTPIKLTNVQGTNKITAEASPAITEYVDGQIYMLQKADGANTATVAPWVTLSILGASQGEKPIRFNFNEEIKPGMFQSGQEIQLMYNGAGFPTTDHFAWVNSGRGISILTDVTQVDPNAILANGGPSPFAYIDKQLYSFKAAATNTGNVTLKSGSLSAHSIKNKGQELVPGQILINTFYIVAFNLTGTVFELVSGGGNAVTPATATEGNVVKFGALPTQLVDSLVSSLGPLSIQKFESGGTWTRPANVKSVLIIATGSGGGGAGSTTNDAGSGGGAGATVIKFIAAAASTYAIAIGTAGGGGTGGGGAGSNGGDVTVGITVVVAQKGFGAPANQAGGNGGATGTGDLIIAGANGNAVDDSTTQLGGAGGGSYWGGGGARVRAGTGGTATSFGSGGAGGPTGGSFGGGTGKAGIVFFLEFA